jgi:endonuclease YncB( thermonuclease family)
MLRCFRQGLWAYRDLEWLEREAKAAKRGLWADPDDVAPWELRRRGCSRERQEKESPGEFARC